MPRTRSVPVYHGFFCAGCKRGSPDARTVEAAKARSVQAGWLIGERSSLCPDCQAAAEPPKAVAR